LENITKKELDRIYRILKIYLPIRHKGTKNFHFFINLRMKLIKLIPRINEIVDELAPKLNAYLKSIGKIPEQQWAIDNDQRT